MSSAFKFYDQTTMMITITTIILKRPAERWDQLGAVFVIMPGGGHMRIEFVMCLSVCVCIYTCLFQQFFFLKQGKEDKKIIIYTQMIF